MKVRGIEARRRDMPQFIKNVQTALLEKMSHAKNTEEIKAMLPELLEVAHAQLTILRMGRANPMDLILRRHMTKEPGEYLNNSVSSVVSNMIDATGVKLAAGEQIEYILIDQSGKRGEKAKPLALYALEDGYDIETYTKLTLKALETLFLPFGYDTEKLKEHFHLSGKKKRARTESNPNYELRFSD
jgi:DNA polymerase elongation subunit (family B)